MTRASIDPETLSAYFDGELPPEDAARVEAALRADPAVAREVEDLARVGAAVRACLGAEAREVPEARFEPIWDRIERDIDAQVAQPAPGPWARFVTWLRGSHARPAFAVAGVAAAAAVVFAVLRAPGGDGNAAGAHPAVATTDPGAKAPSAPAPSAAPSTEAPRLAHSGPARADEPPAAAPAPPRNDAEVEFIEFDGGSGRIEHIEGRRGTTTVIWVREEEPTDTEREL